MPLIHTDPMFRPQPLARDETRAQILWADYRKMSYRQREWLDTVSWDVQHTETHWIGSLVTSRVAEILKMEK